jgi:Phage-related lysozyme (muraminidase)
MTDLVSDITRDLIAHEGTVMEGTRHVAYQDHLGYWTIGYGRLIDKGFRGSGIREEEAQFMLSNDIKAMMSELDDHWPWWRNLEHSAQRAVVNMAFQLGMPGLRKFKNMAEQLKRQDYCGAADAALDSLWAKQTPRRAQTVAAMIRNGR